MQNQCVSSFVVTVAQRATLLTVGIAAYIDTYKQPTILWQQMAAIGGGVIGAAWQIAHLKVSLTM